MMEKLDKLNLAQLYARWEEHRERPDWALADYMAFGEAATKNGDSLLYLDVLERAVAVLGERFPSPGDSELDEGDRLLALLRRAVDGDHAHVDVFQHLAQACVNCGQLIRAEALLVCMADELGLTDEETLGLLGRVYKDRWRFAPDADERASFLQRSLEAYLRAYNAGGEGQKRDRYWSAINAATMARLAGGDENLCFAGQLAQEVLDACTQLIGSKPTGHHYWLLATSAEANIILGRWDRAAEDYKAAVESTERNLKNIASTWRNARFLLLESPWPDRSNQEIYDFIGVLKDEVFRIPTVVVFCGHMLDAANRNVPRFPPELEPLVAEAITARLQQMRAGIGFASGACGSDLIFHERMLEVGGEAHMVLPYGSEAFDRESVLGVGGPGWSERYAALLKDERVQVQETLRHKPPYGSSTYEFTDRVLLGLARMRAQQLETELKALAVWNGELGDGPGGTANIVQMWARYGLEPEFVDLRELVRDRRLTPPQLGAHPLSLGVVALDDERPRYSRPVKSILFTDTVSFSKLNEAQLSDYIRYVLEPISGLVDTSGACPDLIESRGDGYYFVFPAAHLAFRFAMKLVGKMDEVRARIRSVESCDLPQGLSLRMALHAGPVYSFTDPVTRQRTFTGTEVNTAARIEPVATPGRIWASESFAALATLELGDELQCISVGMKTLPKGYGRMRLYMLAPCAPHALRQRE
jgi:class 3 adenylate cyclase